MIYWIFLLKKLIKIFHVFILLILSKKILCLLVWTASGLKTNYSLLDGIYWIYGIFFLLKELLNSLFVFILLILSKKILCL
ncbi:MAG: hypothetical protein IEMM0007_0272 [bacterium]|nr:MAG: hypothetical protein IEMM0007_0272 [bacterium]